MNKFILAIDCGTQSMRGIIFDDKGDTLYKTKVEYNPIYYALHPGWAEKKAEDYWDALVTITKSVKQEAPALFEHIEGITVTTQRDTCVNVDAKGRPLRPAILWADNRLIDEPRPMILPHTASTAAIGMLETIHILSKQCKAHWIQDNQPEIWEKTYKYLLLSGYLNFKLTGHFNDSVASQIGHIPLNYKQFKWEGKWGLKRQIFQIEEEKCCDLVMPGQLLGHLTKEAANETGLKIGIPVIASGSDKGCETIGVGCLDDTVASISLGSQASIQTTSKKYYEAVRFIPPFPAVIPNTYNPEIQIYRGFWMISWFKEQFSHQELLNSAELGVTPEELLNKELNNIAPGCDGLMLQPLWGPGLKSPEAKGSIIGFSDHHTRIHMYRAIVEGIGFALKEGLHKIENRSGKTIQRIMISGGGSQSDVICQIYADLFNKPVYRVQTYETSALGASIVAYTSLGLFNSPEQAVKSMVHMQTAFTPNPKTAQIYDDLYNQVYLHMYGRMRPLFKLLRELTQKQY